MILKKHKNNHKNKKTFCTWRSGVVVSALASINKVYLRRLVLRWVTVSGFSSWCRTLISVCNRPATQGQLSLPSLRGRQMSTSFDWKAKAGMVHSVSGWMRCVQVKLWDPLRTHAIPERLRDVFTTMRYTNPRLPYRTLPYLWIRHLEVFSDGSLTYVLKSRVSELLGADVLQF